MESVSCHQKGLVMGNILWSVDKKIYSDKEDHTLAITGWAITRDQSECDFILYGSGKELSVPEPSRCERADVAKDLKETKDIKEVGNVGFTVKIPEIIHKLHSSRFTCKGMCNENSFRNSGEC